MLIDIQQKLILHTKVQGTPMFIPGTDLSLTPYTKGFFLDKNRFHELSLPLSEYICFLDLQKGKVIVSFKQGNKLYRYALVAGQGGINIINEKENLKWSEGEFIPVKGLLPYKPKQIEKLSFGVSKALDWSRIQERDSLLEFFPILFAAGQWSSPSNEVAFTKDEICSAFTNGFEGMLVARTTAFEWYSPSNSSLSRYALYKSIRALFFQEEENSLKLLPSLPVECHSGRMVNIQFSGGILSLEWTKKSLRRASILAQQDKDLFIRIPSFLKQCRLTINRNITSKILLQNGFPLQIKSGHLYDLDHFTK